MTTNEKVSKVSKLVPFTTEENYKPLELYSIQDKKIGKFMPPFFCVNEEDAIRQCKQIVNYSPSLINKFPQDYVLFFLGTFDEYNGVICASNCVLDGFIAYLDEYKSPDTIQFDEIKKEIIEQKTLVQNNCVQLEKLQQSYEDKMKDLSILYNKYEKASNNLPQDPNKLTLKKSIVKKLFSNN